MFLSRLFKNTKARAMLVLAGLTMVFGVGAAICSSSNGETIAAEAAAPTAGKWIYAYNSPNYSPLKAYVWKDGGSADAAWSGASMTRIDSTNTYRLELNNNPESSSYNRLIFNNGSNQTKDLTVDYANSRCFTDFNTNSDSYSSGKLNEIKLYTSTNSFSTYTSDTFGFSSHWYSVTKIVDAQTDFDIIVGSGWMNYESVQSHVSGAGITQTGADGYGKHHFRIPYAGRITIRMTPAVNAFGDKYYIFNGSDGTMAYARSYSVTLNTHGGTINAGNVTKYFAGDTTTLPTNVTRSGYTFKGWYTAADGGTKVTSISSSETGAKTYHAQWTANSYTVTVALDGGEGAGNKSYSTSASAQTVALDTPTKSGYTFAGYTVTSGPTSGSASITSGTTLSLGANTYGAITVTATWTQETFTLSFDGNGGTGTAPDDAVVGVGTSYTMPSNPFSKTGYSFGGWNTKDDGSGSNYSAGTSYELDYEDGDEITLYAKWTLTDYTITYKDKGNVSFSGTHGVGYPTSYNYGTGATLDTPTKNGYTFGGYYTNTACTTGLTTAIGTSETGNKTFYAKWDEYKDFWISFDGGTTKQALTNVSAKSGDELYQLSTTSTLTVFGGDSITFWRGATAGTATAFTYARNGLTADTTGGTNNVVTTSNTWKVRNYATDVNVYLKIYSSANAYKFYLGGKTGTISSTTNGVSSGSTFYVQDLIKKNGSSSNFGTDSAKIGVYFFNPVDELNSVASWTSAFCTKLSTVDNVDLYSVTVPSFSGHSMKWGSVEILRFNSGTSTSDMNHDHAIKDGSSHYNGVKINSFSSDIQNGVQITGWSGGTSGDAMYPCAGNAFMYTDGGLASGKGVYIDITTAPAGGWKLDDGYGIYCYFFSVVNGSGEANAWSAQATLVPGETKIYECEVPQYSSANVEWAKLVVVNNNTAAFVKDKNQYQTQDLWYNATMRNYQHITFTGSYTGELKAEAASNSSYTDSTRAASWGTRFKTNMVCDGDGSITTDWWSTAKTEYNQASKAAQGIIWTTQHTGDTGTDLQKALFRYDYIVTKYPAKAADDFINRLTPADGNGYSSGDLGLAHVIPGMPAGTESPLTTTLWIVLASGAAGLSAIGAAYFISKKKKRHQA